MQSLKCHCRLCGSDDFTFFLNKNGFKIERCRQCSLVQITDDLSEVQLGDYYGKEFFDNTYSWLIDESKGRKNEYAKFKYSVPRALKFKDLLERQVVMSVFSANLRAISRFLQFTS